MGWPRGHRRRGSSWGSRPGIEPRPRGRTAAYTPQATEKYGFSRVRSSSTRQRGRNKGGKGAKGAARSMGDSEVNACKTAKHRLDTYCNLPGQADRHTKTGSNIEQPKTSAATFSLSGAPLLGHGSLLSPANPQMREKEIPRVISVARYRSSHLRVRQLHFSQVVDKDVARFVPTRHLTVVGDVGVGGCGCGCGYGRGGSGLVLRIDCSSGPFMLVEPLDDVRGRARIGLKTMRRLTRRE